MASRTYEETHPWVNFTVNLKSAPLKFWMLLGEGRSSCEHIAGVPLRPVDANQLYDIYLTKGVHATTSIEGNTLSEKEVHQRVAGTLKLPESREYLGREVDNIVRAYKEIIQSLLQSPDLALTPGRIGDFNATVLQKLVVDEETIPGEFRHYSVGVAGYRGAPAKDCDYLIHRLCDWLNSSDFVSTDQDMRFAFALIKAILAHLYIAWIHPFGDGNGRTARLIEYQLLVQSGLVPLPAGHLLSNHYNKTRSRYYHELEKTSQSGGEIVPFLLYSLEGFVDGLREQLTYIRECQYRDMWVNYVHDRFRSDDSITGRRQKHLVLDFPTHPVERSEISVISPRVAAAYATKGEKTLTRDLNKLVALRLLRREGRAFVANRAVILAFLPPKVEA